jgi:AcrR family transcriptional regulator
MGDSLAVSAPSDPKQARSRQTKEKIVNAAIKLFQERGYEKTTSNDIAGEARVSIGSFYVYFNDKRQLLLTIFDRLADELFKNTFENFGPEHLFDSDIRRRIRQVIAQTVIDKRRFSGLHRVICELVLKDAEFAQKHKVLVERSVSRLREIISLAKKAGLTRDIDVDAASFVVHRVVFDVSQDYVTGVVEFDLDRAIDSLADMIHAFVFKPTS